MPRNGSNGSFVLADTLVPATLADANEVMTILNDIASALTDSVAADGQTPITGQLKGFVSANPTYSFNADLNTGVGSDTADEVYLMAGGIKIAKVSAAGLDVLSGKLLAGGAQLVPTGVAFDYVGAVAPAGYVLGSGGSIGNALSGGTARANADTEPLFTLIWNSANIASGEGQVQDSAGVNVARGANPAADFAANRRILVADYRDRTSRGKSGSTSLGQTGGSDTVTLAQSALPNVTLNVNAGATNVPISGGNTGVNNAALTQAVVNGAGTSIYPASVFQNILATLNSALTSSINGGVGQTAVPITTPHIVKSKIIKL